MSAIKEVGGVTNTVQLEDMFEGTWQAQGRERGFFGTSHDSKFKRHKGIIVPSVLGSIDTVRHLILYLTLL